MELTRDDAIDLAAVITVAQGFKMWQEGETYNITLIKEAMHFMAQKGFIFKLPQHRFYWTRPQQYKGMWNERPQSSKRTTLPQ